jgi:hypothetical protein
MSGVVQFLEKVGAYKKIFGAMIPVLRLDLNRVWASRRRLLFINTGSEGCGLQIEDRFEERLRWGINASVTFLEDLQQPTT